jgi:hypothetical protein
MSLQIELPPGRTFNEHRAFAAFDAATQCVAQSSECRCELLHIRNGAQRQDLRRLPMGRDCIPHAGTSEPRPAREARQPRPDALDRSHGDCRLVRSRSPPQPLPRQPSLLSKAPHVTNQRRFAPRSRWACKQRGNVSSADFPYPSACIRRARRVDGCCPRFWALQWALILPREFPYSIDGALAGINHAGTTEDEG